VTSSWETVQVSSNGQYMVATVDGGDVYVSSDYGVHWTDENLGAGNWYASAMSESGQYMIAGAYGEDIYESNNYGVTWQLEPSSGAQGWSWMASSSSGQHMVATSYGGDAYTSSDYGVTWTDQTATSSFQPSFITSSASGQYLATGSSTSPYNAYTSSDYGVTWTDQTDGPQNVASLAYSANGQHLVAAAYGGDIFTADNTSFAPPVVSNQSVNVSSNSSITVNVLSGVSNADSSSLSTVASPTHGTAVDYQGSITYTPNPGYVGTDSLMFQVCSSIDSSSCAQATLTFNVTTATPTAPNTGAGLYASRMGATAASYGLGGFGLVVLAIGLRKAGLRLALLTHRKDC
jgi:hypothetical protein